MNGKVPSRRHSSEQNPSWLLVESLEQRVLFSDGPGYHLSAPAVIADPALTGVDISPPTNVPRSYDAGDHYYHFDEKQLLLRPTDEVVVGLKRGADRRAVIRKLTAPGAVLGNFKSMGSVGEGAMSFTRTGGVGRRRFEAILDAVKQTRGVAWASPAFLTSSGGRIWATNRLDIILKPGVDPRAVLRSRFKIRYVFPDNVLGVTLRKGGGLDAFRIANRLRNHPAFVTASPSFFGAIRLSVVPNDNLYSQQWNVEDVGSEDDVLSGGTGIDRFFGGSGDDVLTS